MRIILDPHQTDDALDQLTDLIPQLRALHSELRAEHLASRDGYPTRSLGGGNSPTNQLDDDGTPIPQHSDPVGRIVVERDDARDDIGNALAKVVQHIQAARRELQAAIGNAARARPPVEHPDPDEIWCSSHLRHGRFVPRAQGRSLCNWCKDELTNYGNLPTRRLVDAHDRGDRLTHKRRVEIAQRETDDRARPRKIRSQ